MPTTQSPPAIDHTPCLTMYPLRSQLLQFLLPLSVLATGTGTVEAALRKDTHRTMKLASRYTHTHTHTHCTAYCTHRTMKLASRYTHTHTLYCILYSSHYEAGQQVHSHTHTVLHTALIALWSWPAGTYTHTVLHTVLIALWSWPAGTHTHTHCTAYCTTMKLASRYTHAHCIYCILYNYRIAGNIGGHYIWRKSHK